MVKLGWRYRRWRRERFVTSVRPDLPPPAYGEYDFQCPCGYVYKGERDRGAAVAKAHEHFTEHITERAAA